MEFLIDSLAEAPHSEFSAADHSEFNFFCELGADNTGYANLPAQNSLMKSKNSVNPFKFDTDPLVSDISQSVNVTKPIVDESENIGEYVAPADANSENNSFILEEDPEWDAFIMNADFEALLTDKTPESKEKTLKAEVTFDEQILKVLADNELPLEQNSSIDSFAMSMNEETVIFQDEVQSVNSANNLTKKTLVEPDLKLIKKKKTSDSRRSSNSSHTSSGKVSKIKRAKPEFNESFRQRANDYWEKILKHEQYGAVYSQFMDPEFNKSVKPIDENIYKRKIAGALLPNYVTVESFEHLQGIDGWIYKENKVRGGSPLGLRWCGQNQNFYNSFVYRHRIDKYDGRAVDKEFLCPYCPYTPNMDLSIIFHNSGKSHYMHHLLKSHGVYTSGEEMPIPLLGKHVESGTTIYCCTECGHSDSINIDVKKDDLSNCLGQFWRHCSDAHNHTKLGRDEHKKREDARRDRDGGREFIFEDDHYLT